MANGIQGKQLANAPYGVTTSKINDNAVTSAKVDGSVLSTNGANAPVADYDALNQKIINLAPGTNPNDAVNYSQLTALVQGLDWKDNVVTASDAALPAYTFTPAGGGTLTANANGALPAIGGVILAVGQRVLIKSETGLNQPYNGIYTVTQVGSGATPFILTRSTDANTSAKVTQGMATAVSDSNSTQYGYIWILTTPDPIVLNTTNLSFNGIPLVTSYIFAAGLTQTGITVSVKKGDGIELASNGQATNVDVDGAAGITFTGASPNGKVAVKLEPSTPTAGGIEFGGTGGIQQKLDPNGGIQYSAVGTGIKLDANSALAVGAGGLSLNTNFVEFEPAAVASTGDGTQIVSNLSGLPFTPMKNNTGDGIVQVYINGVRYRVANGGLSSVAEVYFSADGGATVNTWANIAAGDIAYRGGALGFDTDPQDGRLMITYFKQT